MKIKHTKEFDRLFDYAGESDKETFEYNLITELLEWDLIPDKDEIYGHTISEVLDNFDDYPIFGKVLDKFGIQSDDRTMSDLLNLTLMDDYDCEECGGEMKLVDSSSRCVGGDGWNTPYEYEVYEKWECPVCGKVLTKNYNY